MVILGDAGRAGGRVTDKLQHLTHHLHPTLTHTHSGSTRSATLAGEKKRASKNELSAKGK